MVRSDTKIALWAAVEEVTGDRRVARHVGESVLEFSVGGLLSTVPELFGLPAARVDHPRCGTRGDGYCEFDVHWTSGLLRTKQLSALTGAISLALIGSGAIVDPVLAGIGAGFGALVAAGAGLRTLRFMRQRIESLEAQVREQNLEADIQLGSLTTLSSDLRLEEVLERITVSAGEVVVGTKFALLIAEPDAMRANGGAELSPATTRCLEQWAHSMREHLEEGPIVMDDLSTHPVLGPISRDGEQPFGSLCAAPLMFRGRLLGVLIALAHGSTVFFAHDMPALETFAGHAAIALSNARLVGELERQAAEDPLTGLPNRRVFELACLSAIDRAVRDDTPVVLAVLDVDHFKRINDTRGHQYGDEVLARIAGCLRSAVRGHDVVARVGGEEFAVLLPGTDPEEGAIVIERARTAVSALEMPHGRVSCSAGVASACGVQARMLDLFAEADQALYRAKGLGRDRTEIASGAGSATRAA